MAGYGKITAQLLKLLATGLVLGFARDKSERRRLLEESDKIWFTLNRRQLYLALKRLKLQGLIEGMKRGNNMEEIRLTNKGRARALEYQFYNLKLKKQKRWNGKWCLVFFDIPETKKKIRDALRRKLKELGFLELQKSVFVFPYPCEDEINFIVNFFNIPENVHYIEAPITADRELRVHFKI